MAKRRFRIVLIKPSHYDDDGYVIQWRRSTIPSNSLASVYGLMAECAEARVLGPDVDIAFEIYDECNTILDIPAISRRILADGGMVALVGVQSKSVSARARHRPPVPRQGRAGRCRRLSRFRLHRHAARIAAGPERSPGAGDHPLCGRGGRAACRVSQGRGFRPAQARLQLPQRHARHGGRRDTRSAARGRDQGRRPLHELRRRTRLPVPVLVLHHHQRAGAQVALSHA